MTHVSLEELGKFLEERWDEHFNDMNTQGRLAIERVQEWAECKEMELT